jgi:periplasmic protein TonB
MFDSALNRGVAPRRFVTGAVISVFGHAAVLTLALMVHPPAAVVEQVTTVIPWPQVPRFTPGGPPGPAGAGATASAGPTRARRRPELKAPAAIPPKIETFAPPDETITGKVVGDTTDPEDTGGGPAGPGLGAGSGDGTGGGTGNGPPSFNRSGGMTRPILLESGREPDYTPEALEAHVQGLMTVECVVTLEGRLQQCRAIHPLPYMERAVVDALMTRRYMPATLHGRPLAVRYVFQVKLVMPK